MKAHIDYDAIVIGGGASGLAAALSAAQHGLAVAIIESDVEAGLKILATGNGRCNLSNVHLDPKRYLHPQVAEAVLGAEPENELQGFWKSLGILTAQEDDRLYPYSFKAESVRDALLDACRRLNVNLSCGSRIVDARRNNDDGTWTLVAKMPSAPLAAKPQRDQKATLRAKRRALTQTATANRTLRTRSVVIATGGDPTEVAKLLGLPTTPLSPVLCPVRATVPQLEGALDTLNGLRIRAGVTLERDGQQLWCETGEVLFRPFGISGVVVFNLSRRVLAGDSILLDLFPDFTFSELSILLRHRETVLGPFSTHDPSWFDGLIAPALARVVCDICKSVHPQVLDTRNLAATCKAFKLDAQGVACDQPAQVTRGGIPFSSVTIPNLACKDTGLKGIYVCGESLDMDADCGGFNLAWAWLSGIRCAQTLASLGNNA